MISVGVRLTVTDKPKKGGTPSRLLGTQNGATLKDNIAMVSAPCLVCGPPTVLFLWWVGGWRIFY